MATSPATDSPRPRRRPRTSPNAESPQDALLLENEGSKSYESLEAVADLLAARGLDEVLIVTDPYHALRSRLIADEVGLDASVSSTDTSVVTGGDSLDDTSKKPAAWRSGGSSGSTG